MAYLIGIDIGGTNIVCGLLDSEGSLLANRKRPTEPKKGVQSVIKRISAMIDELLAEQHIGKQQLAAVGVGTPGIVDPEPGISIMASNLGWKDIPFADQLTAYLGVPAYINNDVRMYIYGEAMNGAAVGYDYVFGITLGTGMAAAMIIKGEIYYGGGSMAGEIGHMSLVGIPYPCACGQTGCLETAVSANGMVRQAITLIEAGHRSSLADSFPDLSLMRSIDIAAAYDRGDRVALEVFRRTANYLAAGLANAIVLFSPDIIVIGGGAALAGERLMAPLKAEIKRLVHPVYSNRVKITAALNNEFAGVIGSALYAKHRLSVR